MSTYSVSSTAGLVDAVESAAPDDTVLVEPGNYSFGGEWRITTDGVTIEAASGRPHFTFTGIRSGNHSADGVKIYGENATFRGFEVSNSGFKGVNPSHTSGVLVENVVVHDCWHTGIMLNGTEDVTVRSCDSYNNHVNNQDADGFNCTGSSSSMARNNRFEDCRAWYNGDDGFDTFASEDNVIVDCWAWNNGREEGVGNGNGFKLGRGDPLGGGHTVERCVAYGNRSSGFWWNDEDDNEITVRHCTAYDNPINYAFRYIPHTVENCISYAGYTNDIGEVVDDETVSPDCDGTQDEMCGIVLTGPVESISNSWDQGIVDPGFVSTDPNSDGFLRLAADSPCRGAGEDGSDLGAFQHDDAENGNGENGNGGGRSPDRRVVAAGMAAVGLMALRKLKERP